MELLKLSDSNEKLLILILQEAANLLVHDVRSKGHDASDRARQAKQLGVSEETHVQVAKEARAHAEWLHAKNLGKALALTVIEGSRK